MSNTAVAVYRMNPAEDKIVFGDGLADGMWVLAESTIMRQPHGGSEDDRIRQQRFRRVTRFSRLPSGSVRFVGEWVDGYQEVHQYAESWAWLVKKTPEDSGS